MVAIKALTVLALAGATIAVPVANPEPLPVGEALERREPQWSGSGRPAYRWSWRWGGQGAREGQSQDQPTPTADATPAASSSPPAVATSAPSTDDSSNYSPPQGQYQGGSNSGSESSTPAAPATPAAQPSSNSGSTGSSSGSGYIGIVNEWRQKMGLSDLEESSMLQGNADKAATNANGQLVHQLNPGTMGQVMAPGNAGNFESVFVGGWLCEIPSLPGLGASVCDSASQGWDHAGQTGHAKILTSPDYSKIGCALETGIWSCDLA